MNQKVIDVSSVIPDGEYEEDDKAKKHQYRKRTVEYSQARKKRLIGAALADGQTVDHVADVKKDFVNKSADGDFFWQLIAPVSLEESVKDSQGNKKLG
jgi:hypothetical protein